MKIAAGEVIERPASVVKELIENSIDAGAKNIRVEIKNGGLSFLRISDDGCGIPFEEVPVAFERHATSKIAQAEDLYNLHTLGFRGEALPSIAAVSQMTLLTRPRHAGSGSAEMDAGSEIAIEGGKQIYHRAAGAPGGTVITVRNLFYNLPARQKWARSGASEAGHILNIVNNYALAYPELRFSLVSEGRLLLQTSGSGDLRDSVAKIYGQEAAKAMLEVDSQPPETDEDGVIIELASENGLRVRGLTAEPNYSKPNRNFMTFFVNRRWVVSRTLSYAVQEAYHSLLMTGRYPVCVVIIELDPAEVDANVHPAKTEVRFLHERQVFSEVQKAVRAALVSGAGGPVWEAPDPRVFASPAANLVNNIYAPPAEAERAAKPAPAEFAPAATLAPSSAHQEQQSSMKLDREDFLLDELSYGPPATGSSAKSEQSQPATEPETVIAPEAEPPHAQARVKSRLPLLRVLGQMANTYVVTEGPDGMYLIDQHAAHERVMYERFQALLEGRDLDRQLMLEPLLLDLSPRQRLTLQDEQKRAELAAIGFDLEINAEGAAWLKAVPSTLHGRDLKLGISEILDEAEGLRDSGCAPDNAELAMGELPRSWRDRLAASLACHSAVRAGQVLSLEEMRELISQLERASLPNACAHGRPTMIHLSQGQLEKGFGRK